LCNADDWQVIWQSSVEHFSHHQFCDRRMKRTEISIASGCDRRSPGEALVPPVELLAPPPCNGELMSVSAGDRAF
jgi:hypothetical protein